MPDVSACCLPDGMPLHPLGVACRTTGGSTADPHAAPTRKTAADDARILDGLRRAVHHGANVFATSDADGLGHGERLLGRLLEELPRAGVYLASTTGTFRGTAPHPYAAPHLHHQLKQTLENLGTDYLDALVLHSPDFGPGDCYLNDALGALRALREQGVIRAVGLHVSGAWPLAADGSLRSPTAPALTHARWSKIVNQLPPDVLCVDYNALTADLVIGDEEVFAHAAARDLPVLISSPLAQGLLTGALHPDTPQAHDLASSRQHSHWFTAGGLAVVQRGLQPLRERFGDTPEALTRVALRYCLHRAPRAVLLVGCARPEHIDATYTCLGAPLTPEDLSFAHEAYTTLREQLHGLAHQPAH